ncbi:MAG: single-stranded DNA-binding protein [Candidatus Peribacteraceae bacterium]|nr:single-stranded DNA-binding protein [Candidatus Peribacteraceae bacterium]
MFSLNRVNIIGYQTQPVDVRTTPGGTTVTDLNLVVPYSFKSDSGQIMEGKSFHTVTVWGPMANIAGQFVKAGSQLFISGRLQTDSWEDEKTKEKRSKTKMVALDLILLDPKDGAMPTPENARQLTSCLNRADLLGNVTRDPELRTTTSGQKVLSLGLATNDRWKDKAGVAQERSEFHNVVVWGDLADECQRTLKKGSKVFVSGRVQTRSFETQAGQKRYATEIVADTISLVGIKNQTALDAVRADVSEGGSPFGEEAPGRRAAPEASAAVGVGAAGIPDIDYGKSEIKVEDLPF